MVSLQSKTLFSGVLLVSLFFGALPHAFAASAIQCHCFKDRSYNETDRFGADDYILATSFNSLLARCYDVPKRQIIMLKMNEGVAQEELLIALKTEKVTGVELQKVLRLYHQSNSWEKTISGLLHQDGPGGDKILTAISYGLPAGEAGAMIADEMLAGFYDIPAEKIQALRVSGLDEKELALVLILSHVSEIQPEKLAEQYKKYGRRNIALTTTAPAGSVSCLTQTTSGIEPAFLLKYTRRKKINDENFR